MESFRQNIETRVHITIQKDNRSPLSRGLENYLKEAHVLPRTAVRQYKNKKLMFHQM